MVPDHLQEQEKSGFEHPKVIVDSHTHLLPLRLLALMHNSGTEKDKKRREEIKRSAETRKRRTKEPMNIKQTRLPEDREQKASWKKWSLILANGRSDEHVAETSHDPTKSTPLSGSAVAVRTTRSRDC